MSGKFFATRFLLAVTAVAMMTWLPSSAHAVFDSGSTGTDAFEPTANVTLDLPPDGVLNFTTVNIPAGVTVKFKKNAANTPVTILASGDVTIAGAIVLDGSGANANVSRGVGGPGGFDGGYGGRSASYSNGQKGEGPGGGYGATGNTNPGAGGGGYGTTGGSGLPSYNNAQVGASGGPTYGNGYINPLLGGSGGGGAGYYYGVVGCGGGGGGGAILIASSGTINIETGGGIYARGGKGGVYDIDGRIYNNGNIYFPGGGGGAGGSIRLVADTITGDGNIHAYGGNGGDQTYSSYNYFDGGKGGVGRIRLEANEVNRTTNTNPSYVRAYPSYTTNPPDMPSLRITSIGGIAIPENARGEFENGPDIQLPYGTQNPVTVGIAAENIPDGTTVTVVVTPLTGSVSSAASTGLSGAGASKTATAEVNLPGSAPALISIYTSYTATAMFGDSPAYAEGERVKEVKVSSTLGKEGSEVTYVTESGKEVLARLF